MEERKSSFEGIEGLKITVTMAQSAQRDKTTDV